MVVTIITKIHSFKLKADRYLLAGLLSFWYC